jgi:hypothetical protein
MALAWHERTLASAEPWYRATLAFDHARLDEMHHAIDGRPFEPGPEYAMTLALMTAAFKDPVVLRAFMEIVGVLTLPDEVLSRPGMFERVLELGAGWRDEQLPGPDREQLLATVGAGR